MMSAVAVIGVATMTTKTMNISATMMNAATTTIGLITEEKSHVVTTRGRKIALIGGKNRKRITLRLL